MFSTHRKEKLSGLSQLFKQINWGAIDYPLTCLVHGLSDHLPLNFNVVAFSVFVPPFIAVSCQDILYKTYYFNLQQKIWSEDFWEQTLKTGLLWSKW